MEENVLYQDQNVLITQSRFVNGGKTYSMRNISSVYIGEIPANNGFSYVIAAAGIICLFFGGVTLVVGIFMILLAGYLIYQNKARYSVRINSNSGETDGLISTDKDYISLLVHHINNAMIH